MIISNHLKAVFHAGQIELSNGSRHWQSRTEKWVCSLQNACSLQRGELSRNPGFVVVLGKLWRRTEPSTERRYLMFCYFQLYYWWTCIRYPLVHRLHTPFKQYYWMWEVMQNGDKVSYLSSGLPFLRIWSQKPFSDMSFFYFDDQNLCSFECPSFASVKSRPLHCIPLKGSCHNKSRMILEVFHKEWFPPGWGNIIWHNWIVYQPWVTFHYAFVYFSASCGFV